MPQDIQRLTFHFKWLWLTLGVGLFVSIIYLSLTPKPPVTLSFSMGDKLGHLLAYCMLMGWFAQLYTVWFQRVFLSIAFGLMGVTVEVLQAMGGHRFFEYNDMVANIIGVVVGWLLSRYLFPGLLFNIDKRLASKLGL